jgi:hypothetical protein
LLAVASERQKIHFSIQKIGTTLFCRNLKCRKTFVLPHPTLTQGNTYYMAIT